MKNAKNVLLIVAISIGLVSGCAKFTSQLNDQYAQNSCNIEGEKPPQTEAEYVSQGKLHFKKSEYQCQFYACDHAIALTTTDSEAYSCRGLAYRYMEHDMVHGLADMTTAIKLRPDYLENYSDRGDIYRADDQLDAALADYQKELELAATPVSKGFAKYDQALAYEKKGNTDMALSTLNEGMALVPESTVMFEERADIYIKMGKFDLAVADLKKAADIRAKTAK